MVIRLLPLACCFLLNPLLGSTLRPLPVMEGTPEDCILTYRREIKDDSPKCSPLLEEEPRFQGGVCSGETGAEAVRSLFCQDPCHVGSVALERYQQELYAALDRKHEKLTILLKELICDYAGGILPFDLVRSTLRKMDPATYTIWFYWLTRDGLSARSKREKELCRSTLFSLHVAGGRTLTLRKGKPQQAPDTTLTFYLFLPYCDHTKRRTTIFPGGGVLWSRYDPSLREAMGKKLLLLLDSYLAPGLPHYSFKPSPVIVPVLHRMDALYHALFPLSHGERRGGTVLKHYQKYLAALDPLSDEEDGALSTTSEEEEEEEEPVAQGGSADKEGTPPIFSID